MTPDKRVNFYVEPGDQVEKLKAGLKQLELDCKTANKTSAWIVVARKDHFNGDYIKSAVGEECSAHLHKSQSGQHGSISLHPYLGTKPPMVGDGSPVLTVFLTADQLAKFDELYSVPTLIVVPFATKGVEDTENAAWREARKPQILTSAK